LTRAAQRRSARWDRRRGGLGSVGGRRAQHEDGANRLSLWAGRAEEQCSAGEAVRVDMGKRVRVRVRGAAGDGRVACSVWRLRVVRVAP
jgi:hypothetical protein